MMGFNMSRLTLFAVITAIENDIRDLVSSYLGYQEDIDRVLGPDLSKEVLVRFQKEYGANTSPLLGQLLPYIDFADSYLLINRNHDHLPPLVGKDIRNNTAKFEKLGSIRNRVMHSRPLQFDDLAVTLDMAEELVKSVILPWNNLRLTLENLERNPGFVLGLEIPYVEDSNALKHNLPIPDFDETGFLGRKQQVAELIKLCLGPYPVISIVGDGGIGKTALALKVAYDILDLPNCPFEAIAWTTSKTTQLTAQEIKRIEGAICDSLGVFSNLVKQLAGVDVVDPVDELIEYLKGFRILLILDNLETILDDRVQSFLEKLPSGSKVIITSRIGLGAFEFPIKLKPLNQDEAVDMLRALAKVRGASDLLKFDNEKLGEYCNKMKNSPGFIKWFVSAVQTGKRPEEVLERPEIFLDFCMSNVYDYLSAISKQVIRSMLCLPGKYSQAELGFINDMDVINLQPAVHELLRTNMVNMSSIPRGSSFETRYDLSDLARSYLAKHHSITTDERDYYVKRKRQLIAAEEQILAEQNIDPYSFFSITMRSRSDLIIAKYLADALKSSQIKEYDRAESFLKTAMSLAPEFFEVHRVEAIIKTQEGNYTSALAAYEAALDLEPKSAPLHKWYGSFLLLYMDDIEGALAQFEIAQSMDPNACIVQLEIARVNLYLKNYASALILVEKILARTDIGFHDRRKAYDLYLQCFYRMSNYHLSQKDYSSCLSSITKLGEVFESIPDKIVDSKMEEKIVNAMPMLRTCYQYSTLAEEKSKANTLFANFQKLLGSAFFLTIDPNQLLTGIVGGLVRKKGYGFIRFDGRSVFFHYSDIQIGSEWLEMEDGTPVVFSIRLSEKRPKAVNVRIREVQILDGEIVRLPSGKNFGFIETRSGEEIFFHYSSWKDTQVRPAEGQKVSFILGQNNIGACAYEVEFRGN